MTYIPENRTPQFPLYEQEAEALWNFYQEACQSVTSRPGEFNAAFIDFRPWDGRVIGADGWLKVISWLEDGTEAYGDEITYDSSVRPQDKIPLSLAVYWRGGAGL
jgi:hypothetical protein